MQSPRWSREIEVLVEDVVQQLEDAIEAATLARARELTEEYLAKVAVAPRARVSAAPTSMTTATPQPLELEEARVPAPRRRRAPKAIVAKVLPPVDPESERRAAELARLRAILRPTAPVAPIVAAAPVPAREQAPDDSLQALENRIRDEIPALSSLSKGRCTARIASWVGRVRLHQTGPDAERTRIASRMLLDKLRNLAWSMDAGKIEGLDLSWSTRNWARYIEESELIAATPDAAPAKSQERPSSDSADSAEASSESDPSDADVWATP
ncbi:MAG TPA: hypothetical protein VH560_02460 [Polyangia bacterium]|jgi:hypothetical protein|nr:hypothetical protein [Polyangia bacterium]